MLWGLFVFIASVTLTNTPIDLACEREFSGEFVLVASTQRSLRITAGGEGEPASQGLGQTKYHGAICILEWQQERTLPPSLPRRTIY